MAVGEHRIDDTDGLHHPHHFVIDVSCSGQAIEVTMALDQAHAVPSLRKKGRHEHANWAATNDRDVYIEISLPPIGACRGNELDNELDAGHPLWQKPAAIRAAGVPVQEIMLPSHTYAP